MTVLRSAARMSIMAVLLATAAPSAAASYVFTRFVGSGVAQGTITTDDTLGVLAAANITGFNISISDGTESFLLTPDNADMLLIGDAFTATIDALFFDFSAPSSNTLLFQISNPGPGERYYCVQTDGCFSGIPGEVIRLTGPFLTVEQTGNLRLAENIVASVPESATWLTMILGFGFIGAGIRRMTRKQSSVQFA